MLYFRHWIALLVVSLLVGADLRAEIRTVRVTGTGRVPVKPSEIELQLNVAGSSELAKDALKKYDQAFKQAKDAFEKLGIEKLVFKPMGVSVKQQSQNQQQVFNGQPQQNEVAQPVTFERAVRVGVEGIESLSEDELTAMLVSLIDTAKDSGASVQGQMDQLARIYGTQFSNAMVFFIVTGIDEARETAYAQAMEMAKRRADRLAKLSGTKIGRVHTISESFTLPQDTASQQMRMVYAAYGVQQNNDEQRRVVSSEYKEVDINVTLTVEFEID